MVKSLPAMQETWIQSLGREDPLEEEMAIHSSILAGEFHGQRSLVGYSLWDRKQLDKTERLTLGIHEGFVLGITTDTKVYESSSVLHKMKL